MTALSFVRASLELINVMSVISFQASSTQGLCAKKKWSESAKMTEVIARKITIPKHIIGVDQSVGPAKIIR